MEARAVMKYVRMAPRKVQQVASLIRGKGVDEAINILHFTPKAASVPVEKALRSAVSNMLNREETTKVDPEDLFVKDIRVDQGPTMKRIRPRAMGRATRIRKRTSHITIVVAEKE